MLECVCVCMLEWRLFIALLKKEVGRRNKDRLKKRTGVANHPQKRSGHEKLEMPEDTLMLAAAATLGRRVMLKDGPHLVLGLRSPSNILSKVSHTCRV